MSYIVYTDGSYKPSINPNVSGWGAAIFKIVDGEEVLETVLYGVVTEPTMRQVDGELEAVKQTISHFEEINNGKPIEIKIIYDYVGVEKWATSEWKANKPDTIKYKSYIQEKMKLHKISLEWTKGHAGNTGNEAADRLAGEAIIKYGG